MSDDFESEWQIVERELKQFTARIVTGMLKRGIHPRNAAFILANMSAAAMCAHSNVVLADGLQPKDLYRGLDELRDILDKWGVTKPVNRN